MNTAKEFTITLCQPTYVGEALDVGVGWRRYRVTMMDRSGVGYLTLLIHDDDLQRGRHG